MTQTQQSKLREYRSFIDGGFVDSDASDRLESINPTTGDAWYSFPNSTAGDVDRAVKAARRAFEEPSWRYMRPMERGRLLRRIADVWREIGPSLAVIETTDNGKLIREMRAQHDALPEFYDYFAGWCDKFGGEVPPSDSHLTLNYLRREPHGVVAAILPWNSPLLVGSYKMAPALAAGNTLVIKPSEHTSASLLVLVEALTEAGVPPGVINVVTGDGPTTGRALVSHPLVDLITFTGSVSTGRTISELAAQRVVPTHLELGGKSPSIVFDDADVGQAAAGIVGGIFAAAGQTCVAGSRVFLQGGIYDEVIEAVKDRTRAIRLGDPMQDSTDMGPIAFEQQMNKVLSYIDIARNEGATVTLGGTRRIEAQLSEGYFVEPTILESVTNKMRVAQEEIFGPVLSVIPFDTEEEVLAAANDVPYGLAAGVWTKNLSRAHRMAHRLDAGTVWINTYRVQSPIIPIGGFKFSGHGKENGGEAMREYTRMKSVWINLSEAPPDDPFVMNIR